MQSWLVPFIQMLCDTNDSIETSGETSHRSDWSIIAPAKRVWRWIYGVKRVWRWIYGVDTCQDILPKFWACKLFLVNPTCLKKKMHFKIFFVPFVIFRKPKFINILYSLKINFCYSSCLIRNTINNSCISWTCSDMFKFIPVAQFYLKHITKSTPFKHLTR